MDTRDKLLNVISYLISIKYLGLKSNTDISAYEKTSFDKMSLDKDCDLKVSNCNDQWITELNKILDNIKKGGEIPPIIEALVDDSFKEDSLKNVDEWFKISDNLFFPLSYSEEQGEVVKKLSESFGLVIQGAPGTGKSHTIVNLICHLLANGKRILVTSQRENPLGLIWSKIPEEVKPLCMSFSGNELNNYKQMESSIKKVTEMFNFDIRVLKKEYEKLEHNILICRTKQENLNKKLKEEEDVDNGSISYGEKEYRFQNVVKWLEENEAEYSWIEDNIDIHKKPPITDGKFSRLLYLISNTNKEEMIAFSKVGALLYSVPSYSDIVAKIRRFINLQVKYSCYENSIRDWCVAYNSEYDYDCIDRLLEKTHNFLCEIEGTPFQNLLNGIKKGQLSKEVLQGTILKCNYYIKKICSIKKEISGHVIEIPKDIELCILLDKMDIVYKQFEQKGKISKIFKVFHGECESILEKCSIDSKPIENKEQCRMVKLYISQQSTEINLKNAWNNIMMNYGAEELKILDFNELAFLEDAIKKIDIISNWDNKVKDRIIYAMKKVAFLNGLDWYSKKTYDDLKKGLLSIKYISEYEALKAELSDLQRVISNLEGFEEVVRAIRNQDLQLLYKSYKKIEHLKENADNIREINYLLQVIYEDCPRLVHKLINDNNRLNMLANYKMFSLAWKWRQLSTILKKAHKFRVEDIKKEICKEKNKEISMLKECLYKRAWYKELVKIEESQKASLHSWIESIKKLGSGKSKNDRAYINLAQKEMENFKDVIPVWIMPINKVIQNFSISPNSFDVVVIEDGSKCDIFALSALFRAKRAIIVGDDDRTSSGNKGEDSDKVHYLIKKYLTGVPNREWFNTQNNLFGLANKTCINKITLKENFRYKRGDVKLQRIQINKGIA